MNYLQIGFGAKTFSYPSGSRVLTGEPILSEGDKLYDPAEHGLNPLPMSYREAREFAAAVYPDKDLMTYRNGRRSLTRLVMNADRLDRLHTGAQMTTKKREVLWRTSYCPRFYGECCANHYHAGFMAGAQLSPAWTERRSGTDDAKVIANILISQFKGPVVIDDFGCYAREHHAALIRQNRLIAGVYTLSELPDKLRDRAVLMPMVGRGCNFEDAQTLAKYQGLRRKSLR
jgi:hypothetical protein